MQELSHPIRLADLAFLVDSTKHSSALIPRSTRGRCNNQAAVCTHQGLQKKKKKKRFNFSQKPVKEWVQCIFGFFFCVTWGQGRILTKQHGSTMSNINLDTLSISSVILHHSRTQWSTQWLSVVEHSPLLLVYLHSATALKGRFHTAEITFTITILLHIDKKKIKTSLFALTLAL